MILSNMSIGISSPFSSDLISTTKFRFIKAPRLEMSAASKAEDSKRRKTQVRGKLGGGGRGGAGVLMSCMAVVV